MNSMAMPSSVCSSGVGEKVPAHVASQFTGATVGIQILSMLALKDITSQGLIADQLHLAALTCDDGACALHALWGVPRGRRGRLKLAGDWALVSCLCVRACLHVRCGSYMHAVGAPVATSH